MPVIATPGTPRTTKSDPSLIHIMNTSESVATTPSALRVFRTTVIRRRDAKTQDKGRTAIPRQQS